MSARSLTSLFYLLGFLNYTESMKFLEKDLEEILWTNLQNEEGVELLKSRGLELPKFNRIYRQKPIGFYGVADLITYYRCMYNDQIGYKENHFVNVIELKKDKVSVSSFFQALKYCQGIKTFFEQRNGQDIDLRITLIGRELDMASSLIFLPNFLHYEEFSIDIFTYHIDINGLKFKHHNGYDLSITGF